jgi:hypothetical protein
MEAIEMITSQEREVVIKDKTTGQKKVENSHSVFILY